MYCRMSLQIPLFEAPKILLMAIYITRSLATLSIIFIPANFGGFVQVLYLFSNQSIVTVLQACKFSGRAVASRLSKSKASNVVMNITTE